MASMDDLIATISTAHVGQQASDLKELHSTLASTLQRGPSYRPIPPTGPSAGPHASDTVPPAPASSWNEHPAPAPGHLWAGSMGNSPRQTVPVPAPAALSSTNLAAPSAVPFTGRRETGFTPDGNRPHHSVLATDASPAETVGFANDAFRPLWDKEPKSPWAGFHPATPTKTA